MNTKILLASWGGMFILCAGLGFIPEPEGGLRLLMTAISVLFFLPPALLIHQARKTGAISMIILIRNLAAVSLVLTSVLLIGNFLSAMSSAVIGNVLYYMLIVVSSPMICSGYWVLSLFLWAYLLMVCLKTLKKARLR